MPTISEHTTDPVPRGCRARHRRPTVTDLQNGDPDAWSWMLAEFTGSISGYARRMGVSDPDDVTGMVLESVARGLQDFSGSEGQFRSWVFTVAHSRIVDSLRVRDRRPEVEFTPAHDRVVDVDEPGAGDPRLEAAVQELTDVQRSLLHLRYERGLPVGDIARMVGRTEPATRIALHRTVRRLRERLHVEQDGSARMRADGGPEAPTSRRENIFPRAV